MTSDDPRSTHKCGACGRRLFTARYVDSGTLVHVERAGAGDLVVVPELPGVADRHLPHVAKTTLRRTALKEHHCPNVKAPVRSFTAAAMGRKVRL